MNLVEWNKLSTFATEIKKYKLKNRNGIREQIRRKVPNR